MTVIVWISSICGDNKPQQSLGKTLGTRDVSIVTLMLER